MNRDSSAYILHTKKYTDNKIIIELITVEYGRISAVYRVPKKTPPPQPFCPYYVRWFGVNELKTINVIEASGASLSLSDDNLFCGIYLNELIQKLVHHDEVIDGLFLNYHQALEKLEKCRSRLELEYCLRYFEANLVESLGYAIDFGTDENGNIIENSREKFYKLTVDCCFVEVSGRTDSRELVVSGEVLNLIAAGDLSSGSVRHYAKVIFRSIIDILLDGKPLVSRQLFS